MSELNANDASATVLDENSTIRQSELEIETFFFNFSPKAFLDCSNKPKVDL